MDMKQWSNSEILKECLVQSEKDLVSHLKVKKQERREAREKATTTEHAEKKRDETCNYYEGIEYDGEPFDDLYNNDPFVKAAKKAAAYNKVVEKDIIAKAADKALLRNEAEKAIVAMALEEFRREKERFAASQMRTPRSPTPKTTSAIEPKPSTNTKTVAANISGEIPVIQHPLLQQDNQTISSPSPSPQRPISSKHQLRPALDDSIYSSVYIGSVSLPQGSIAGLRGQGSHGIVAPPTSDSRDCGTCNFPHLRASLTCPNVASEAQLRVMIDTVYLMPPTARRAAYKKFLTDQLVGRAVWKKNRNAS